MTKNMKARFILPLFIVTLLVMVFTPTQVYAATSPSLGTAETYSVIAGSEVTNTGATTISGDVGISPGIGPSPHYSGFGTVTLGGTIHDADANALQAQADSGAAYAALAVDPCDTDYGAVTKELAGENLVPGIYCANSFHLTAGILTLNGTPTDVWIFRSASDLIITGGGSTGVVFTGGGLACNVWWRVVSTATLDANSSFVGTILADTSITLAAGASINGRTFARTAEVTLSSSSVTGPTCSAPSSGGSSSGSRRRTVTPPVEDVVYPPGLAYVAPASDNIGVPTPGKATELPVTGVTWNESTTALFVLLSTLVGMTMFYTQRRKQTVAAGPIVKVTYI